MAATSIRVKLAGRGFGPRAQPTSAILPPAIRDMQQQNLLQWQSMTARFARRERSHQQVGMRRRVRSVRQARSARKQGQRNARCVALAHTPIKERRSVQVSVRVAPVPLQVRLERHLPRIARSAKLGRFRKAGFRRLVKRAMLALPVRREHRFAIRVTVARIPMVGLGLARAT